MPYSICRRFRPESVVPTVLALLLGLGWAAREIAFARDASNAVTSQTITVDQLKPTEAHDRGQYVGENGVYLSGETPASTKFVTGRFVLPAGKTPHLPHTHVEEEVMIVESGDGEIFCDGKTTKVAAGSVMYTTPNAPHGITNTGTTPMVFYYVKWAAKGSESSQKPASLQNSDSKSKSGE